MLEELSEENMELLERYKKLKDDPIMMVEQNRLTQEGMYASFTLEEIIRLSHLIASDEKWSKS